MLHKLYIKIINWFTKKIEGKEQPKYLSGKRNNVK
tara:strand:+ start:874 stop:978 length:105 start_codon:yes stop_codon:yes gene_type:complete